MGKTKYFYLTLRIPANTSSYATDISRFINLMANTVNGLSDKKVLLNVQHFGCDQITTITPITIVVHCNLASADNGMYIDKANNLQLYNDIVLIENSNTSYSFQPSTDTWLNCNPQDNCVISFTDSDNNPLVVFNSDPCLITLRFKVESTL
jgi:hypothetical protein